MKTELFHYYNKGTDKHHIFISQEFVNYDCYFYLGGELAKRGIDLEFYVIHKNRESNMSSILTLNDKDFSRQGMLLAEKLLSLLSKSGSAVYDKKLKDQLRHFIAEKNALETQLEGGYDEGLWRQLQILERKIEAIERKLDGTFYQAEPETFKLCGQNQK